MKEEKGNYQGQHSEILSGGSRTGDSSSDVGLKGERRCNAGSIRITIGRIRNQW